MNKPTFYDNIISSENLYKAIYAVDSYITEKNLLSAKDRRTLLYLRDKFSFTFNGLISQTIEECRNRLTKILNHNDILFDVEVYFKLKKFDPESENDAGHVEYRPMHTAPLIDQICMAALLIPLMFDDKDGKRELSELSQLIPTNFFGNIPSRKVSRLFVDWREKYSQYSKTVNAKSREYLRTHEYDSEISFDLKDFFPSIDPKYIFDFIYRRLSNRYSDEKPRGRKNGDGNFSDRECLKVVLTKLLYFSISKENLCGWETIYYKGNLNDLKQEGEPFFMTRGVAQGLPQSYFFGNLCMIEVAQEMKKIQKLNNSEAFFYVDDSVVFARDISKTNFKNIIDSLNEAVGKLRGSEADEPVLSENYLSFSKRIKYQIQFHPDGKSEICDIEDSFSGVGNLYLAEKPVYHGGWLNGSVDILDDNVSFKKLQALEHCIDNEIKYTRNRDEGKEVNIRDWKEIRLKWLYRYKRFFIFRKRVLQIRLQGFTEEVLAEFYRFFKEVIPFSSYSERRDDKTNISLLKKKMIEIFDSFEEDIMQSEIQLMFKEMPNEWKKTLRDDVSRFEQIVSSYGKDGSQTKLNSKYLYYTYVTSYLADDYGDIVDEYESLRKIIISNLPTYNTTQIINFLRRGDNSDRCSSFWYSLAPLRVMLDKKHAKNETDSATADAGNQISESSAPTFPCWASFIFYSSEDFRRRILNCYFSLLCNVPVNDSLAIVKTSIKPILYFELRILAYLRNRCCNTQNFFNFVRDIDEHDLNENMDVDLGILEALGIFRQRVSDPKLIDQLIQTHRLVRSLWHNGSKFLNSYTLHNQEHAVNLIKNVTKLINCIDFLNIKGYDYFLLFCACYLHDISMVIHPTVRQFCDSTSDSDEILSKWQKEIRILGGEIDKNLRLGQTTSAKVKEIRTKLARNLIAVFNDVFDFYEGKVRSQHAFASARYIRQWSRGMLSFISNADLQFIADVSESHGWDIAEIYNRKSKATDDLVSFKYMTILIRLADLLDLANDRIDYFLLKENHSQMNLTSLFHWISHLVTDRFELDVDFNSDKSNLHGDTIKEQIFLNIFLNSDLKAPVETEGESCKLYVPEFTHCSLKRLPVDNETYECMDFNLQDGNLTERRCKHCAAISTTHTSSNQKKRCPLVCLWMTKRHEWLFVEFARLSNYLNSVNSDLIDSSIHVRYIFKDVRDLDDEFRDDIIAYLSAR